MGKSEGRTYLQCTHCGKVYETMNYVSIEELYLNSYCPYCGNTRALNIGEDKDELYLYYDNTKDERYY